jgi:hypothetical protein
MPLGKEPIPLLKLPAKFGDTWNAEIRSAAYDMVVSKSTYKVGKEELIEVPAGKFNAIPVETYSDKATDPEKPLSTTWFAPGVGIVKSIWLGGTAKPSTVLKSFTEGK